MVDLAEQALFYADFVVEWPQSQRRPSRQRLAMHQDSSQLRACLDPVRGIRDLQLRRVAAKPVHSGPA